MTSIPIAGLLRFGHKKKECMRQESTLVYTGGALSWHVSIIFREKNPLPFSEEHDDRIECIMGIGPDIVVFLDYHTKVWACCIGAGLLCGLWTGYVGMGLLCGYGLAMVGIHGSIWAGYVGVCLLCGSKSVLWVWAGYVGMYPHIPT